MIKLFHFHFRFAECFVLFLLLLELGHNLFPKLLLLCNQPFFHFLVTRITVIARMSRAQQNMYVNNIFDGRKTEQENILEYEECLAPVDKSIYDELSSTQEKGAPSNDSVIMNLMPSELSKQSDNSILQKKLALLRPMFLILLCIPMTALVTAIATFFATKNNLSDKSGMRKYITLFVLST